MNDISEKKLTGQIDGLVGQGISGWALRPSMPEIRLWIELLVDDVSLGVARAEHFHPEAASFGDGCYGFWIPVPGAVLNETVTIGARVANTGEVFAPLQTIVKADTENTRLTQVKYDGGLRLSGWAIDAGTPKQPVTVRATLKGKILASTQARQPRFKPAQTNGHGFTLTLPLELADGENHLVDVVNEKNVPLLGSPVHVQSLPQNTSEWLEHIKVAKKEKQLVQQLFERYEKLLPKSVGFNCYLQWKKIFPPDLPKSDAKRIGICTDNIPPQALHGLARENKAVLLKAANELMLPNALGHMAHAFDAFNPGLVYGDAEEQSSEEVMPQFKPAWDPYLFFGYDYLGPVLVSSEVILALDLNALNSPIAVRTTLILAASEKGCCHLPTPLSSCTSIQMSKERMDQRRNVLQQSNFWEGALPKVLPHPTLPELNRLSFTLQHSPKVSILIPTRDRADLLAVCLNSLWQISTYENIEILIVDNGSIEQDALALFDQACEKGARVISYPHPFNYSAMNNLAAKQASGEYLCFLNNDTEVVTPDWLQEMVALAQQPDVGCVGAKLHWPNDLVQHGGVVVGTHQLAAHVGNGWTKDCPGYMNRNQLTQQWSAVTAACLVTPRSLFLDNGGFDPVHFPVVFNDVDYCIRLRKKGKKILWSPWAILNHHESASRGKDVSPVQKARSNMEMHHFRTKWGGYHDPFYNPNLTLSAVVEPFDGLALPPHKREIR